MRQPEAEAEAARRNLEDDKRDRYVFYALDVSAGLADDAWEVSRRLRRPEEALEPVTAAARADAATASAPEALAEPATAAARRVRPPRPSRAAVLRERAGAVRERAAARRARPPGRRAPTPQDNGAATAAELPADWDDAPLPEHPRARSAPLIRAWAIMVILIGVLFVAATLVLAFALREDARLGAVAVVVALTVGSFTVWLGVALWRS
jgi:hypothetical protein